MSSTVYMMLCGAILGVVSATQGIYVLKEPLKYALLNFIPLLMISLASLPVFNNKP